ncbi:MAG: glutamate synthase-related protein [Candidatus Acidiferrales bacterium]
MDYRYHIETGLASDIVPSPSRFRVRVKRHRLALLLLKELIHYRGNKEVVLSRPCLYGVFGGPVGGFAPRDHLCVGCLRCTTEHPHMVQVTRNPEHARLGDSYFNPVYVENVLYEARSGRIPVKGAGYRGPFGGEGWDGMWTDMSEIVRPTRDGIHGREFISTSVDLGSKPPFLVFDEQRQPVNGGAQTFSLPVPVLFDAPPPSALSGPAVEILSQAAREAKTLFLAPVSVIKKFKLEGDWIVPRVKPGETDSLAAVRFEPPLIELEGWDQELYAEVQQRFPRSLVSVRLASASREDLLRLLESGVRVFHLVADYHGRGPDGRFIGEIIREAHKAFVDAGRRDEVTLLGSGGIIAAEHVPKAIICGADAVVLDTPLLVALQAEFQGECADRARSGFRLPRRLVVPWGVQRLKNLVACWRDQLLEVLGAMGLREVRRLRGELGRAMFQKDLEQEAFAGIEGYGR